VTVKEEERIRLGVSKWIRGESDLINPPDSALDPIGPTFVVMDQDLITKVLSHSVDREKRQMSIGVAVVRPEIIEERIEWIEDPTLPLHRGRLV